MSFQLFSFEEDKKKGPVKKYTVAAIPGELLF